MKTILYITMDVDMSGHSLESIKDRIVNYVSSIDGVDVDKDRCCIHEENQSCITYLIIHNSK